VDNNAINKIIFKIRVGAGPSAITNLL